MIRRALLVSTVLFCIVSVARSQGAEVPARTDDNLSLEESGISKMPTGTIRTSSRSSGRTSTSSSHSCTRDGPMTTKARERTKWP